MTSSYEYSNSYKILIQNIDNVPIWLSILKTPLYDQYLSVVKERIFRPKSRSLFRHSLAAIGSIALLEVACTWYGMV